MAEGTRQEEFQPYVAIVIYPNHDLVDRNNFAQIVSQAHIELAKPLEKLTEVPPSFDVKADPDNLGRYTFCRFYVSSIEEGERLRLKLESLTPIHSRIVCATRASRITIVHCYNPTDGCNGCPK